MCPLLHIEDDRFEVGVGAVSEVGRGVVGANSQSVETLEQQEVATLRLRLSDDKILANTVGKTPVMVLQVRWLPPLPDPPGGRRSRRSIATSRS